MTARRLPTLPRLFGVSLLSAAIAVVAATPAAKKLPGLAPDLPLSADAEKALAYTVVFAAGWLLLSFLSGHVAVSRKAKGTEKTRGAAPLAARGVLVLLIFLAPLAWMHTGKAPGGMSSLSETALRRASPAAKKEQGYAATDRDALENLIGKESRP